MAKKINAVHVPLQMGFGFEVLDAEGKKPDFLHEKADVYAALDLIQQAMWVSVDVETTGLTDASSPVALAPQDIRQGASNVVRMRTIQARVPTVRGRKGPREQFVFDCDKMGPKLTQEVAEVVLSRKIFIAHNAGFDLYWLRLADGRRTMPEIVIDSMLLTRLLRPELVLKRAELIADISHINDVQFASETAQAAWKSLIGGASGGSLADVVLAMFGVVVDKTYQKPTNWTGLLGFGHHQYALDDVVWADRIVCELLELDAEGDIYQAYLGQRARKFTVRLIEPQVPELVMLRENGMPLNATVGERYVIRKRVELAQKVEELIALEPTLAVHRETLANPDAGLDEALKKALAVAFEERGVVLRRTAATAAPQVGEKDLRACKAVQIEASRPLFNAWVAVCRSKKSSNMALEVVGFAHRSSDGRLRSLLSHGPVTGRLAASEPNCFTGDTEILTASGWVRFDALRDEELVAQYDRGDISFVRPHAHIREEWSGELVHTLAPHTDLLTTPLHRCLLVGQDGETEMVSEARGYLEHETLQQVHAGWFVGGPGSSAASSAGELLSALRVPAADGVPAVLRDVRWLFELNPLQLLELKTELLAGASVCSGGHRLHFTLTSEHAASAIQTVLTLCGLGATVVDTGEAEAPWHVTVLRERFTPVRDAMQARIPYSGQVYCVSVPSGFIVVRRNGCVMVTGQCQQWPRDQLFRAMCMSPIREGCEVLTVEVTALLQPLVEDILERPVSIGETVELDTAWTAGMVATDKLQLVVTEDNRVLLEKCTGKELAVGAKVSTEFSKCADVLEAQAERKAFIKHVDAQFTHTVVASDFGALDVRVGAALCIRSQREMLELAKGYSIPGPVQPPKRVVDVVREVAALLYADNAADLLETRAARFKKEVDRLEAYLEKLKVELDSERIQRKKYFQLRGEAKDELLSVKLGYRFAQCLALGARRGEKEYSALRDAFVADIDIHTFTGMKLVGRDPMKEFEGLSVADRKSLEKKLKKELGPRRQQGKIANLSLLYGMADAGFQEAAARGYDEHWSMQEAHDIRALWMNAYPEVELWHLWTECLQLGVVYVPEQGREKPVRTGYWMARTLAGREIVAFGLNAALSYQDQSSGADILGLIMHRLRTEYPHIFQWTINQVHDEQVFSWPSEHHEEYLPIVEAVMVEEANSLTMPYGVPTSVSPAAGCLWIKD